MKYILDANTSLLVQSIDNMFIIIFEYCMNEIMHINTSSIMFGNKEQGFTIMSSEIDVDIYFQIIINNLLVIIL